MKKFIEKELRGVSAVRIGEITTEIMYNLTVKFGKTLGIQSRMETGMVTFVLGKEEETVGINDYLVLDNEVLYIASNSDFNSRFREIK